MDEEATKKAIVTLQDEVEKLKQHSEDRTEIWLEVSEVRYETDPAVCKVVLKADRGEPKPVAWPVREEKSTGSKDKGEKPLDIYKSILNEMDKKRVVLARLSWDGDARRLHCDALRFQSPEMGNR